MSSIEDLFSCDNKFFFYIAKFIKLVLLNLMMIVFSLPIFTIGSAFAALYAVMLKVHTDEEGNVITEFWKAFRDNFKQATYIWLHFLGIGAVLFLVYWLLRIGVLPGGNVLQWVVYLLAVVVFSSAMWSFILQSRYENEIRATMRNGFAFSFVFLPATLLMLVPAAIPVVLLIVNLRLWPIVLVCGISGPALLQAAFYSQIFKRLDVMAKGNDKTEIDDEEIDDEEIDDEEIDDEEIDETEDSLSESD